jgi:hypothetical protein
MMVFDSADAIGFCFGIFNLLRLASYFPQIVAVLRDDGGARAISLSCWVVWIGANATTALYAWVRLGDLTLASVSAFNAACCLLVFSIAAYKRLVFVRVRFAKLLAA